MLSVVVPVFNEESTVVRVLARVLAHPAVLEVVVVDDASTDATWERISQLARGEPRLRVFRHEINQGKGAALRTAFGYVTGGIAIVQDADMEYDPAEYGGLIEPIARDQADVVFGSRFVGGRPHRVLYFWHSVGNQFLTLLSNMFSNLNLTDMECCYKAFRREVIQSIDLKENRFGFEPEVTAKVARMGLRIYEVPVSYHGRTYEEGKKITWKDGVRAIWCILKYNIWARGALKQ